MQLIHGDCLEVMPTLPDGSVDAIVTDPPYNEVHRDEARVRYARPLRQLAYFNKGRADTDPVPIDKVAAEFARITRGSIYVWCGTQQAGEWRNAFATLGLSTRLCVWEKSNPAPINGDKLWLSSIELCVYARKPKAPFNRFCKSPVWRGPLARVDGFPCPKPVWLMEELITASVPEGGVVLDAYLGSGTTGVACANTGRGFIGIEKDASYFAIAQERIAKAYAQEH